MMPHSQRLTPLVYEELRRLAHHFMEEERRNHTLQRTALVNEAYLRLTDQTNLNWQSRAHTLASTTSLRMSENRSKLLVVPDLLLKTISRAFVR